MTQYYVDKNGFIIIPKENPKPKKDITIEEYLFLLIKDIKLSTIKKRTTCLAEKFFSDWTSAFFKPRLDTRRNHFHRRNTHKRNKTKQKT